MPRFFVKASDVSSGDLGADCSKQITIHGNDAAHITRVLRMKPGERLVVCDSKGVEYETVILSVGEECVLKVESEKDSLNEPPYKAVIYQALVKGDKFETVIQKGTEMGAAEFVPVVTKRCVVKLDAKDSGKKVERWQRIAEEAAKQCGRGVIPTVRMPVTLKEALSQSEGQVLFCYEGEGTVPLSKVLHSSDVPKVLSVFIGPEGGFEEDEVAFAGEKGADLCGLGRRILRTETASLYVLSCLSYRYEL
ncbi:MAG: 16S rRNA (uracil(1498)-N(3))-methyltransferase [Ruminococcaceae bacterium]|nr:16S rRNA (uracil(1498)-N(3))-methyltransferase [Oscillospiraceae bacterium]